jgi:hypothetical protein
MKRSELFNVGDGDSMENANQREVKESFRPIYQKRPKTEIGKELLVATADHGDDAAEVRVSHGCARRRAQVSIKQILGHFCRFHTFCVNQTTSETS